MVYEIKTNGAPRSNGAPRIRTGRRKFVDESEEELLMSSYEIVQTEDEMRLHLSQIPRKRATRWTTVFSRGSSRASAPRRASSYTRRPTATTSPTATLRSPTSCANQGLPSNGTRARLAYTGKHLQISTLAAVTLETADVGSACGPLEGRRLVYGSVFGVIHPVPPFLYTLKKLFIW